MTDDLNPSATDRSDLGTGPAPGRSPVVRRRRIVAAVAATGAAAWVVPCIASAPVFAQSGTPAPGTTTTTAAPTTTTAPPASTLSQDLTTWSIYRQLIEPPADGSDGQTSWSVSANQAQTTNNGDLTWLVSPESFATVVFEGFMQVVGGISDYIGLVAGFNGPTGQSGNQPHDHLLFDWKQSEEDFDAGILGTLTAPEGWHTTDVSGTWNPFGGGLNPLLHHFEHRDEPGAGFDVLVSTPNVGWVTGTEYGFRLSYSPTAVTLDIAPTATAGVLPTFGGGDRVADLTGTFPTGRVGFYVWSVNGATFRLA